MLMTGMDTHYDIKEYIQQHRELQFDNFDMTSGPKSYT